MEDMLRSQMNSLVLAQVLTVRTILLFIPFAAAEEEVKQALRSIASL